MNPASAKDLSEVVGVIARWETKWKELERTEGVRLPDMVKMAALTELCPPDIRDLIFQTVDSGLTFDTMKEQGCVEERNASPHGHRSVEGCSRLG